MEPESRQPAPGPLGIVQAFVNTADLEQQTDELATPARLRAWLADGGLLDGGTRLNQADLDRAIEFREALRALLLANNGQAIAGDAVESLNRIGMPAALHVRFEAEGQARLDSGATGVDQAIGRLLAIVFAAMVDGSWPRLKACRNHACHWAFYDTSKNRSGAWCSMAICGSRVKARAYRQRQRLEAKS